MRTRPGCSGSLPATGWSSSGPKRSASVTCSPRVMSWSRKKRTLYCISRSLISSKRPASRAASARLTLRSSAPIVAVRGKTSMDPGPTRNDGSPSGSVRSWTVLLMTFSFSAGLGGRCSGGGFDGEDRGADAAAGLQVAVRGDGVLEGVALVDLDRDAAGADVVEELAGQGRALRRVGDVVGQRGAGDEQRALDGELHRVDRRDGARRRAEADQEAAPTQRVQRRGECRRPDAVEDDRDAGAVGDLADPRRDVLPAVDDGVLAPVGPG